MTLSFSHPFAKLPTYDAASGGAGAFGDLPEWDLSDLYTAPDAPELTADMAFVERECAAFAADYEGKLADLDAAGMARHRLVHRVVQNLGRQVMIGALINPADIHAGAQANGL